MADWTSSIELTHNDRVWVRRCSMIEEMPSLDLDPDSVPLLPDDPTLERAVHGGNRGRATAPPALVRAVRQRAEPVALYSAPLLNEGPNPHEATPPTFDMGLMPAVWDDDDPTELGGGPSAIERFRASMELADYDEDCASTELITKEAALANLALAKAQSNVPDTGTHWSVHIRRPPLDPETSISLVLQNVEDLFDSDIDDDMSLSLTLDLDPAWLVVQEPAARVEDARVRNQVQPLLMPTPTPTMERAGLAGRVPPPAAKQPMRNTLPTYLRTAPPSASGRTFTSWVVNTVTFMGGIAVGGAAATMIVALSATAALLV